MISSLPDSVLSHILSLLPTKLAVSTCVLSKRWQFLWTMAHNLDLECDLANLDLARHPHFELLEEVQGKQIVVRFIKFVNKFFTQRDKDLCLKKFHLKYMVPVFCSKHVDSWISAAISSGVEEFVLDIVLLELYPFRCSVHACKTLVVLKLSDSVVIDASASSIHFQSLKLLYMHSVHYENQHSFSNLLFGCPVLENLEMHVIGTLRDFVISLPTLRRLVIDFYVMEEPIRLAVDAPSLEYLNFHVLLASEDIYLKNLDNFVEAILHLYCFGENIEEPRFKYMVKDAFGALYNVRDLELVSYTMHDICDASFEGFPLFHNLVQLNLNGFCCYWRMLLSLLQKLPFLQHLTIMCEGCSDCHISQPYLGSESWAELYVPNCFSRLRTLCFDWQLVSDDDNFLFGNNMDFLTNVLKNSKVLENVSVTFQAYSEEKMEALKQKLASLERASKNCELKIEGQMWGLASQFYSSNV